MKVKVKWLDAVSFEGSNASDHKVIMDGPESAGGQDQGFRPMEMLLLGIGGCSSFDVIQILKKSKQQVKDCIVNVEAQRVDAVPAVFKKIHLQFEVSGKQLKPQLVKRAVALSSEKYCSASLMMQKASVEVTHDVSITEVDTE